MTRQAFLAGLKELLGPANTSRIPSRRPIWATLSSPRRPSRTIGIFSSDEKCRRVARRMSRIMSSAGSLPGTVFCLVLFPYPASACNGSLLLAILIAERRRGMDRFCLGQPGPQMSLIASAFPSLPERIQELRARMTRRGGEENLCSTQSASIFRKTH
jgi:hypothetical protein